MESAIDNRQARRHRILKDGKIVFNRHASIIDCSIRDRGTTGARLQVGTQAEIPDEFELLFVSKNEIVPARVMWRRGELLGIAYTGELKRAPPRKYR